MSRPRIQFTCPKEGHATLVDGHYISLGRDSRGRLLAIITEGHPNAGDAETVVCSVHTVKDSLEATVWFAEQLIDKPWLPRVKH